MLRYTPLVFKNCWRNKRRTSLTVLSVAASLSLLGVLLAIYHAFYFSDPPPDQALRLIVRNKVSLIFSMPEAYAVKIKAVPGVREVMMQNWFGGVYKDRRPENLFARFSCEPDKIFTIHSEWRAPEDQKLAFQRDRAGAVVGKPLADKYGWKLGDKVTLQGDIFQVTLELNVRAIFEAEENAEVLYFNRQYLEESLPARRKGQAGMFAILADSADSVPKVQAEVDEMFRNSTAQTKTEAERQFQLGFINSLGNVKAFLLSICAAVTFTVLLVTANTMAMSVRERVKEVGILKTLGFTRETILGMILGEAVTLSILGGVLGLAFASLLCFGVRQLPAFIGQLKTLDVAPSVALACLAIAAIVGLVSSFMPAWGAARANILDALRGVD